MEMEVELTPHVAKMNTPVGPDEVKFQQWFVSVNGTHIGYLGFKPGSPLNIIRHLPEATREKVVKAVNAKANLEWPEAHAIKSSMVPPEETDEDEDE